jgi:hypothetical protein
MLLMEILIYLKCMKKCAGDAKPLEKSMTILVSRSKRPSKKLMSSLEKMKTPIFLL